MIARAEMVVCQPPATVSDQLSGEPTTPRWQRRAAPFLAACPVNVLFTLTTRLPAERVMCRISPHYQCVN